MAEIGFKDIINKEIGKIGVVTGLGPSLKKDIELINGLDRTKYVIIGCNDYDLMTNMTTEYWIHANSIDTISKNYLRYNKRNSILIFADSVDTTPRDVYTKLLTGTYLPYDQRHFKGNHCTWGHGPDGRHFCCYNIQPNRLTIQEELIKYTNSDKQYGTGDTVAVHMLSVAILLGCKKIYITGVDLDYSKGYINGGHSYDSFNPYLHRILEDFKTIYNSGKAHGVEIYITNDQTLLKEIIDIKQINE